MHNYGECSDEGRRGRAKFRTVYCLSAANKFICFTGQEKGSQENVWETSLASPNVVLIILKKKVD